MALLTSIFFLPCFKSFFHHWKLGIFLKRSIIKDLLISLEQQITSWLGSNICFTVTVTLTLIHAQFSLNFLVRTIHLHVWQFLRIKTSFPAFPSMYSSLALFSISIRFCKLISIPNSSNFTSRFAWSFKATNATAASLFLKWTGGVN